MKKSDFKIGKDFFTASGRWMCTDIGSRTIAAIKKDREDHSYHRRAVSRDTRHSRRHRILY